jgi:4-hydroxy-tetrahydrodipicolinate synthase
MALVEATVAAGVAPDRLLPGTGVAAFTETVALTRHALSCGVTTVVMLPPFYYKGVSDDGVFAAYSEILQRIGDSRLRVVLYHIPQMSAVPISHAVIERLIAAFPETVVGIKDSSGDLANMEAMVEKFPGFSVLAGADPAMLPLRRKGGAGCITATSNLVARDLAFVFRHAMDDSKSAEVDAAQARVVAERARASRFPQMASLKAMTAQRTGNPGWMRLRPPLLPLTEAEAAALAEG